MINHLQVRLREITNQPDKINTQLKTAIKPIMVMGATTKSRATTPTTKTITTAVLLREVTMTIIKVMATTSITAVMRRCSASASGFA